MKTFTLAIGLTIAVLSIAGCGARERVPEEVPVDRIQCARCRMLISTATGTGQIVSDHESTRFYDDIGCLAADWREHERDATAFVNVNGAWTDARAAAFAKPADAETAMGYGFVAHANTAAAKSADRNGNAMTWDDVLKVAGR